MYLSYTQVMFKCQVKYPTFCAFLKNFCVHFVNTNQSKAQSFSIPSTKKRWLMESNANSQAVKKYVTL